jgi:hypothetical protein
MSDRAQFNEHVITIKINKINGLDSNKKLKYQLKKYVSDFM